MALWPNSLTPMASTPLAFPGAFVSVSSQGGKLTSRKHEVVGSQWTEDYELDLTQAIDRGWLAAVQQIFYDGAVITDKTHHYENTLLGSGGTGRVSGSGQTGDSIVTFGWEALNTALKAGDIIRFASGSSVVPIYQVTSNFTANAAGSGSISLVPDVLDEFKPAHSSSLLLGSSVTIRCMIVGLALNELSIRDSNFVSRATVAFRESL